MKRKPDKILLVFGFYSDISEELRLCKPFWDCTNTIRGVCNAKTTTTTPNPPSKYCIWYTKCEIIRLRFTKLLFYYGWMRYTKEYTLTKLYCWVWSQMVGWVWYHLAENQKRFGFQQKSRRSISFTVIKSQ